MDNSGTPSQADLSLEKKKIASKNPAPKKTRRKGKKSIAWNQDVEILARLAVVSDMMTVGAKPFQIANSMQCSLATAKRDIARVRQTWAEDAIDDVNTSRNSALAQYKLVQMRAWDEYGKPENAARKHIYLATIVTAQKEIDRILGVGPQKIDLGGKVEITEDLEAIRKRRWSQIEPQVAELLKQSETVKT